MTDRLNNLSQKSPPLPALDNKAVREWYEFKQSVMEGLMGKQHDMVMHAIIPYAVGGGLDLYYYPKGIPGTGVATMELSEFTGRGSSNRIYSCYELVMFTRHPADLDIAKDTKTPFGRAHDNIRAILNKVAPFSRTAKLNSNDTCEFPAEMKMIGGKSIIFHDYGPGNNPKHGFGIILVIEIFRSEMEFARKQGGENLIKKLKEAGHYPYSDLEREPVA